MSTGSNKSSTKSVISALVGNTVVLLTKIVAFVLTAGLGGGSSAMLAEIGHSIGDVSSQAFLLLGIHRGNKKPDDKFALGYGKERYFWSSMAAVVVIFLAGIMLYHGIETLIDGHAPKLTPVAIAIFSIAAIIESITFTIAFKGVWKDKAKHSFRQYIKETTDPSGIAVLLEDFVAVVGVAIALGGITLTKLTGSPVFDTGASMIIGILMLLMGIYLVNMNRMFLIGRSHEDTKRDIEEIFRSNPKIERTHDLRAMVHGVNEVVVQADIELREEEFLKDISGGTKTRFSQILRTDEEFVGVLMTKVSTLIDELEHQIRMRCPEVTRISIEIEQFKSPADQMAEPPERAS